MSVWATAPQDVTPYALKPLRSKKLRQTDHYRPRTDDYRIVYSANDEKKIVKVLSIAHPKEVCR
jgi:mRNA-degrading endonuclease RelE of RelBE toxin-antitoxin system